MTYSDFLLSQALISAREHKGFFQRRKRMRQKAQRLVARRANGAKAQRLEDARMKDFAE